MENLINEEWRDVVGYEGYYQVSNHGRIISLHPGKRKFRKLGIEPQGYATLMLRKPGSKANYARVHRLLMIAFVPNPHELPMVNHINGIKTDNHISNLEWSDNGANQSHARSTGLSFPRSVLFIHKEYSEVQVKAFAILRCGGFTLPQIALLFKVHTNALRKLYYKLEGGRSA